MKMKTKITMQNVRLAIEALGMEGMDFETLGLVMRQHEKQTSFSSACIARAAKHVRFKRRLGI